MHKDTEDKALIQEACEALMDTSGRKDVIVEINSAGAADDPYDGMTLSNFGRNDTMKW